MSAPVRALVALDGGIDRQTIESILPYDASITVVGVVDGLEESWTTMQETPTDLLVVGTAESSDRVLFFIDGAVKERPDRPVVVLATTRSTGFVRRAFEAGADDIVILPESQENVRFALEKAIARKRGTASALGIAVSPMVCVLGPKGGTGKTLTCANIAAALASEGRRVAAVDLDLQFGDLGLALGLSPDRTIYDLVKAGGSLDAGKLDAYMATHESGARVLMAPTRPDQAAAVEIDFLREVYATLRSSYDFVVVDTPPGFTPEVIASIDSSTHVCMVGMLDSLSLKNTKLGLETLELMGYEDDRIQLVLNRADTRVGITPEDAIAVLGRKPDILVPSDREIPRSVNEGDPIVVSKPRTEAARAYRALADSYFGSAAPAPVSTNNHQGHQNGSAPSSLSRLAGLLQRSR
jgi:pilus assembly protein CpaE